MVKRVRFGYLFRWRALARTRTMLLVLHLAAYTFLADLFRAVTEIEKDYNLTPLGREILPHVKTLTRFIPIKWIKRRNVDVRRRSKPARIISSILELLSPSLYWPFSKFLSDQMTKKNKQTNKSKTTIRTQ